MNKLEFIETISREMDITKEQAKSFVRVFLQEVTKELCKEEGKVVFQGFGGFSVWEQTERPGRNPRTGKPCVIRPRKSVKFRPSKHLVKYMNKPWDTPEV